MTDRIAYFISEYPARSHTFIRREIAALRQQGLHIDVFAIRKPAQKELLDEADLRDAAETTALLPAKISQVLIAHWSLACRNPFVYFQTLKSALSHRLPGIRNLLWALFYFVEAGLLAKSLLAGKHTHLHVHFAISCANIARLAARMGSMSWSLTLHGACDFEYPNGPLLKEKIEEAAFTCCISRYGMSQAMRQVGQEHWHKLQLSRCGIDPTRLPRVTKTFPREINNLIYVGRFSAEKGQLGLLKAFANLVKRHPHLQLTLVGDGDDRAKIESTISNLGIANNVKLTGALPEQKTLEQIAAADLFVLPSFMEGIPVVLMEALSLEVPVVAPRVAGIPELIEDKVSGLLFTTAHWADLEAKIEHLIEQPELAQKLVEQGKLAVSREFYMPDCTHPLLHHFTALSAATRSERLPPPLNAALPSSNS